MKLRSHSSCVYNLQYHLVFTTKYRRPVLSEEILEYLYSKCRRVLAMWDCSLIEIKGESDHLHLLFEAHPSLQLSELVNNLKSVTSRGVHKEFNAYIKQFLWKEPNVLWSRSYCILSAGGATIERIKHYIQNQGKERNSSHD